MPSTTEFVIGLGIAAVLVCICSLFVDIPNGNEICAKRAAAMNMERKYERGVGCLFKVGDKYVPLDNIKFDATNGEPTD